jgi:hypothetical protein
MAGRVQMRGYLVNEFINSMTPEIEEIDNRDADGLIGLHVVSENQTSLAVPRTRRRARSCRQIQHV